MKNVSIHVDGAMSGTMSAGAAAVARTQEGYFLGWLSRQLEPMTNNEAEYQAALLGLLLAQRLGPLLGAVSALWPGFGRALPLSGGLGVGVSSPS